MKKIFIAILILAVLASCTSPLVEKSIKTTSVSINIEGAGIGAGSKTLMPDLAATFNSYTITLSPAEGNPFATKT